MKRFLTLLLALLLLSALAVPALADVAYMPRNDFLEKHQSDCSYENRSYYANGADGLVMAWDSPKGAPSAAIPNGNLFFVSYVYTDEKGETWGCIEYDPRTKENASSWGGGGVSAWVKMGDMLAEYDWRAFDADHRSEYTAEERSLTAEPGVVFQLYRYPGSGEVVSTLDSGWLGVGETITFNQIFTDPAGRDWGFIGYLYGHRNAWVCLDDPANGALPADENCVTLSFNQAGGTESPQTSTFDDLKPNRIHPRASDEAVEKADKAAQKSGIGALAGAGGVVVIALAVLAEVLRRRRGRRY